MPVASALSILPRKDVVRRLFTEVSPPFSRRDQGGYTRILKLGPESAVMGPKWPSSSSSTSSSRVPAVAGWPGLRPRRRRTTKIRSRSKRPPLTDEPAGDSDAEDAKA